MSSSVHPDIIGHIRALNTKIKQLEDHAMTRREDSYLNEGVIRYWVFRLERIEKRIAIMLEKIDGLELISISNHARIRVRGSRFCMAAAPI